MKRILLSLTILLVLPSVVCAENHYVTQSGGGDGSSPSNSWSVDDFNDPGNWNSAVDSDDGYIGPGDTVYFSGDFNSPYPDGHILIVQGSGSPGNPITFDGYEAGDCRPIDQECAGSALLQIPFHQDSSLRYVGLRAEGKDYITIQDFRMEEGMVGIFMTGDDNSEGDHIFIKRNYIKNTYAGSVNINYKYGSDPRQGINHVTIGGSPEDGNFFENFCASDEDSCSKGVNFVETTDGIFSYNKIGTDYPEQSTSTNCIELHQTYNMLFEYNDIYGAPEQGGISIKEGGNDDVIVRFNNFHDCDGDDGRGLSLSWYSDNIVVYGNMFTGNLRGITPGKDSENLYIWSNVIVDNFARGIEISKMTQTPIMSVDNCHIMGNTIANNGFFDDSFSHSGLYASDLNGPLGVFAKNNIFLNNGEGSPDYYQITALDNYPVELDYNQYYDVRGTVTWMWGGSSETLAEMQVLGQELNGNIGNPGIQSDYTILGSDSDVVNTGTPVSNDNLPTITIQGVPYGPGQTGDQYYGWDTALHPSTDWTTTPPTVITASQNDHGSGWERGAYVYVEAEPQDTCSSLNGYCCISPQTCPGTDLGTYTDCSGTCCSEPCQAPTEDTCTDRGFHCCDECVTGTEHPENDTNCPVVCCGECLSQPIQGDYNYSIIKTSYLLVIDADLSEFSDADTVTVTDSTTGTTGTYRLMWDEHALYIAAQFSDTALNTDPAHADDDELWRDDSLEIMFDTLNDGGDTSPHIDDYKFYAIPSGAYADSQRYDMSWDSGLSHDVSVQGTINQNTDTDTGWVVEMAIPWQDWGIAEPVFGYVWGMNIQLNDMTATDRSSTQWSGSGLSVNIPDGWNDVLFTVRADSSRDGCVHMNELVPFIDSWKYDSTTYPMREMMGAVVLYYNPGDWC